MNFLCPICGEIATRPFISKCGEEFVCPHCASSLEKAVTCLEGQKLQVVIHIHNMQNGRREVLTSNYPGHLENFLENIVAEELSDTRAYAGKALKISIEISRAPSDIGSKKGTGK